MSLEFFDEVETTVANTHFLRAVKDAKLKAPVDLHLTDFDQLGEFEKTFSQKLDIRYLLKPKKVAYYQFKKFLLEDGRGSWVSLLDDIGSYRFGRFLERKHKALGLWQKYLESKEEPTKQTKQSDSPKTTTEPRLEPQASSSSTDTVGQEATPETTTKTEKADAKPESQDVVVTVVDTEKTDEVAPKEQTPETKSSEEITLDDIRKILVSNLSQSSLERMRSQMNTDKLITPGSIFDDVLRVAASQLNPRIAAFRKTTHYRRLVQVANYAKRPIGYKDFRIFRPLGRGSFGTVYAVQKIDTGAIYAMKEMNKKHVKSEQSEWSVQTEKRVLSKMSSPFVLNLKYSFHDPKNLYLCFDMALGGDLRFHLRSAARGENKEFSLQRAQFYAAEVFLGLEHIHSFDIVYRDLKPHNVLLDMDGHVKISDLGLAVQLRPDKLIKHLAGTAGYWSPEVIMKTGTYKVSDYWSFGAFLYEMIQGQIPSCKCTKKSLEWCPFGHDREHEEKALKEEGILKLEIDYSSKFSSEARDLLEKLFIVEPQLRLGAGGAHEIKEHPFFASIDWQRLEALDLKPPYQPDEYTVYAESVATVGDHSAKRHKKVTIDAKDEEWYEKFSWFSEEAVQEELLTALEKLDNPAKEPMTPRPPPEPHNCCCGVM